MAVDRKSFLRLIGLSLASLAARKSAPAAGLKDPTPDGSVSLSARRWAMVVDSRKCLKQEGCDRCIRACNRSHNIPGLADPRHKIKWIWKEPFGNAFDTGEAGYANEKLRDRPFVLLCNHCDRPPCVRVCPTQATWRRQDGIVMMDWHRCIGCRYCMAACPYGARSFNWSDPGPNLRNATIDFPMRSKGVVEKCTFCAERLVHGMLPACVLACGPGALQFGDLEDPASSVRAALGSGYSIRRKTELGTVPEV